MAERAWGGREEGQGAVLLAVCHKLVVLVQTALSNATVQMESAKALLYITAYRRTLFPAVDTCQLSRPFHFSNDLTVFRRGNTVDDSRSEFDTEQVTVQTGKELTEIGQGFVPA